MLLLSRSTLYLSAMASAVLLPLAGLSQDKTQGPNQEPALAQGTTRTETTTTLERRSVAAQAEREAQPYQTREGRLKAKPLDWNSTLGQPGPAVEKAPVQGKPETSQPGKPSPNAKGEAQRLHPEEWRNMKKYGPQGLLQNEGLFENDAPVRLVQVGTADVFSQYCEGCLVPNIDYPEVTVGKLFLNGGFCSASVVSGNNVIVTAAHCCYDRGNKKFIGGWVFAPGYNNGNAPYGTFNWSSATVLNSWINNGDIPSDVCTIKLANDGANHGVTFYTGWLGRSWNFPSDQDHHALGYPGNLGGGNVLELCTSESFGASGACGGGDILNTGCSMTFGSSGGPWVRSYRGSNWVNSVVHGYSGQSCTGTFGQTFNGARFNSGNIVPVCNAAGC